MGLSSHLCIPSAQYRGWPRVGTTQCLLRASGWLHDSGMHPCELGQGQAEWQTPCCIKMIPSLDTGWLSLEHICVTWPSLPSGWVHFPGGFSGCHASRTSVDPPLGSLDLPRPCLDPGVKTAWAQTNLSYINNNWNVKRKGKTCEREEQWLLIGKAKRNI